MTASQLLGLLLSQAAQIAILALIVWGMVHTVAKRRSHLAHALWALVLVKCVTPPLWSSPTGLFSWTLQPVAALSADRLPDFAGCLSESAKRSTAIDRPLESPSHAEQVAVRIAPIAAGSDDATAADRHQSLASSDATDRTSWRKWSLWVCGLWVTGALLGLMLFAARFTLLLRRLSRTPVVELPQINEAVERVARRLGLRRRVAVRILDDEIGPAVLGLFRPLILLPRILVEGKSVDSIEPLLAHELIHIRRGDLCWSMLHSVARSLWWFYPPVWFAARMQAREAEQSCDEETIACLGCEPAHYARALLQVLEQKHRLHVAPALPGVRPVDVTAKRLERIMRLKQGCCRQTPRWVWGVIVLAGLAVLPGTGLVRGQDQEEVADAAQEPSVLPDRQHAAAKDRQEYALVRLDVGSILTSLTDSGHSRRQAESKLLQMLPASPNDSLERTATLVDKGRKIQLGGGEPRIQIHGDTLYVFESKETREVIGEHVAHYRRYGFDALEIETSEQVGIRDESRVAAPAPPAAPTSAQLDLPDARLPSPASRPWTRWWNEKQPAINLFGKQNKAMSLSGKLDVTRDGSTTILRGQQFSVSWDDGDRIRSDSARIGVRPAGEAEAWFKGNVTVSIGDVRMSADDVKIVGESMIAAGNVRVASDGVEFSADQLNWLLGGQLDLRGRVRAETPTAQVSASSIRLNPQTNEIESAQLTKLDFSRKRRR